VRDSLISNDVVCCGWDKPVVDPFCVFGGEQTIFSSGQVSL
jgi:hypothetical protein